MDRAIDSGIVRLKWIGDRYHVYVHANYIDLWQVSTAMLYYQKFAKIMGNKHKQRIEALEDI